MATLTQVRCVVIASEALCLCHTLPCSDYSREQTAPASSCSGEAEYQCREIMHILKSKDSQPCNLQNYSRKHKRRNDTMSLGLSFISLSMCGTWHLIWTPTNTEEISSLPLKGLRRTRWNDSIQSAADVEPSQAMQLLMASEWKSSLNRGD